MQRSCLTNTCEDDPKCEYDMQKVVLSWWWSAVGHKWTESTQFTTNVMASHIHMNIPENHMTRKVQPNFLLFWLYFSVYSLIEAQI